MERRRATLGALRNVVATQVRSGEMKAIEKEDI